MPPQQLDWTWDEQLLALDLYLRRTTPGPNDPEVQQLSEYLRSLPIYPVEDRLPEFRNAAGVSRKLGDIHSHRPGYGGTPTSGSKLDDLIWERFLGHEAEVPALAAEIRRKASQVPSVPEPDEEELDDFRPEGRIAYRLHRTRERSKQLRRKKVESVTRRHGRLLCEACGNDLATYGAVGQLVFEVHHLTPLSVTGETTVTMSDLALLCPTCHRIAHRMDPWPDLNDLRALTPQEDSPRGLKRNLNHRRRATTGRDLRRHRRKFKSMA